MNKYLLTGLLLTTAMVSVSQVGRLQGRIQELEQAPHDQDLLVRVTRQLHDVRQELEAARLQMEKDEARRLLESRLGSLESRVVEADSELAQQEERLAVWERVWHGRAPAEFEQRLVDLRENLERRWRQIDELTTSAASLAQQDREKLLAIEGEIKPLFVARDTNSMWHDLVGPIVQLSGDSTVGSGVLLESIPRDRGPGYDTYLLTSWHVVRDIYGSPDRTDKPVPVKMYHENGRTSQEYARMIIYDVALDAALLVLMTDRQVPCGARLASRERLARTRIFDRVYAVGCPLGNDPIPTSGEVAATNHEIDGATYWMISAPTYIGNSGGGIYDAESRELIGIFSKIYTHGSMRSTIVPHMGLMTPMTRIYDWLERNGQSRVANAQSMRQGEPKMAAAALR